MRIPTFSFGPGVDGHASVVMTEGVRFVGASVTVESGSLGIAPADGDPEAVNDADGRRVIPHPSVAGRLRVVPKD